MYPQGSFRNPYSIYGTGDRSQTARQPSRLSVPVSQTQTQPQPQPQPQQQQQQQQVPKPPEAKKEETPKPTQPARLPSKPEPQVPKEEPKPQEQKKVTREPKIDSPTPPPLAAAVPASVSSKELPPTPSVGLFASEAENNKNEKLSIVPADQIKAIVNGSNPQPEQKSLQQGIKEEMTNLTRKLSDLNAQQNSINTYQKQPGQSDLGVRVITMAGENRGATMDLGSESKNNDIFGVQKGQKVGGKDSTNNEENQDVKGEGSQHRSKASPVTAYVNSNVQAANNSILYNSTCPHRDPGVRLALSNSPVHSKEIGPPSKRTRVKPTKDPKSSAA